MPSDLPEPAPAALIVEDDRSIRHFVRSALVAEGWKVHEAETLAQARDDLQARKHALLLVDLGLPDGDGVEFILEVRRSSQVPLIVLSARSAEIDKVRALDAGADDYVEKPFGISELLARVRAHRRRRRDPEEGVVEIGHVAIDLDAHVVRKSGREVHLTPTEYKLLKVLVANIGRVLTHRALLREVWGPSHVEDNHYLRIFMGTLRHKLEDDPALPRMLLTETGVGYRLVQP
jgi:two-component system KDP operon response regulator KdpE